MARQILMKVMRGVTRPVWEPDAGAMALRRTEVSPGEQPALMGSGFAQHGMIDVADIEAKARRMRDTIVRQQGFGQ
jgi:hypothetical protein